MVKGEGPVQYAFIQHQVDSLLNSTKLTTFDLGYGAGEEFILRLKAVEYYCIGGVNGLDTVMAASGDALQFGLTTQSAAYTTVPYPDDPGMLDYNAITRKDYGAAAQANFWKDPFIVKNFTEHNPEGLVLVPTCLGAFAFVSNALGAAFTYTTKITYTIAPATPQDYQAVLNQILINRQ